jgi:hypothetical protein
MEVLWPHHSTPALLLWSRRLPSINVDVLFDAPAANAPALYKQARTSHFFHKLSSSISQRLHLPQRFATIVDGQEPQHFLLRVPSGATGL